jgi:hypothetical protein
MVIDLLIIIREESNFKLLEAGWERIGFSFVLVGGNWREGIGKEIILISFLTHRTFS